MPTMLECPHCHEHIELVGQRELSEDFRMKPNPVAHARQKGEFPTPILEFGNRNMWLRADIEEYVKDKSRERISKLVQDFERTIAVLPDDQKEQARELLLESDGGTGRGRRR